MFRQQLALYLLYDFVVSRYPIQITIEERDWLIEIDEDEENYDRRFKMTVNKVPVEKL